MKNTHAETHSNYTVEIVQIFRTMKEGEAERFRKVWLMHCWIRIFACLYFCNSVVDILYLNLVDCYLTLYGSFLIQRIGCFCGMVLGSQTGLEFYLKVISSLNFLTVFLFACVYIWSIDFILLHAIIWD